MDWCVCSRSHGQPPGPRYRAMICNSRAMFLVCIGMLSALQYEPEATMAKKIGVILSGCGVTDGAEIQEAVLTLLAIDRAGAEAVCMAPTSASITSSTISPAKNPSAKPAMSSSNPPASPAGKFATSPR